MRRFFIDPGQIRQSKASIAGSDARHIRNVLRLKPGDRILLVDGKGVEHEARISGIVSGRVEADIIRSYSPESDRSLRITVAQGFLKERKMDVLVRQLTELGIHRWMPYIAGRSVARPDARRLGKRKERWEKIAREAVKQCRRTRIPEIGSLLTFDEMLDYGEPFDIRIFFWEKARDPLCRIPSDRRAEKTRRAFVVLGPEGGLTDREADQAKERGFAATALGPRILRADTATLAACALVQHIWGDMG